MGSRCTGHCCETFTLPFSPDELETAYHRWKNGSNRSTPITIGGNEKTQTIFDQIYLIAPMVKYLGFSRSPIKAVNKADGRPTARHYYTCKHYDKKSRKCTIYEMRPQMCREYPYGRSCNYAACTWTKRKEKKETPKARKARLKVLNDPGGEYAEKEKAEA